MTEEILNRIEKLDEAIQQQGIVIFYSTEEMSREWLEYIFGWPYILQLLLRWNKYKVANLQAMRAILMQERQQLIDRYCYEY